MKDKRGRFVRERFVSWTPENWDDGYVDNKGRFRVYRPDYPKPFAEGYALRAHVVWWLNTGAIPDNKKELHHKNENKLDDRFENLVPLSKSMHRQQHSHAIRQMVCSKCGKSFSIKQGRINGGRGKYCSNACYQKTPRTESHRAAISRGLQLAYQEGRR